jgi:hypothetical protein
VVKLGKAEIIISAFPNYLRFPMVKLGKAEIISTCVGFEVLTVLIMNASIFWSIALCSPYLNRHFEGTYHLHFQGRKSAKQETEILTGGWTESFRFYKIFKFVLLSLLFVFISSKGSCQIA